jgi:DNA polymerase-3 subunit gamma/tau
MSYLVLARKYRPQTFEEIVGQEHVTRTLANAFAKGRVHHAFLFCGARGVGKTTAARVLAKALCCDQGPTATPCGVCSPCQTVASGTAVDYFEIDGASNNGVDDIRELRDGVRYQPAQLRRKIYVIDEVHMLSVAAFNALLKTLEEPPPHVTFVFATTEVHKIPVTILSRCQRYDFKLVPQARIAEHLQRILSAEAIPVEAGALTLLAREAGGSVRDSLSLTDQVIAYAGGETLTEARVAEVLGVADRALLFELCRAVLEHEARAALLAVDAAVLRGVDLAHLARSLLGALRDRIVVAEVPDPKGLVDATPDELERLTAQVRQIPKDQLIALFDRLARACEELARSPSPRLIFEIALCDMATSEPLLPLAELVSRLEQMEGRLGGAAPRAVPAASPARAAPRPVPAPPPAVVKATGTPSRAPENPMAEWERVILALEKKSLPLAAMYTQAHLLGWSAERIELGFADGSLQARLGADSANVGKLKQFLAEFVGSPLDVKVKAIPSGGLPAGERGKSAPPKALADVEQERRLAERSQREQEARAHPAAKAVMETFGAPIKEIKID